MNYLTFLLQNGATVAVVVILWIGYVRAKAWIDDREEKRELSLSKRIHEGVVAALNNGGAEPVRRLLREEVGAIIHEHEKTETDRFTQYTERLARLEGARSRRK